MHQVVVVLLYLQNLAQRVYMQRTQNQYKQNHARKVSGLNSVHSICNTYFNV